MRLDGGARLARGRDDQDCVVPAIVPATSLNFSASSAAASGCAPEGGVFNTSRLMPGAGPRETPAGRGRARQGRRGFLAVRERLVTRRGLHQLELGHVRESVPASRAPSRATDASAAHPGWKSVAGDKFQDLSLPKPFVCVQSHGVQN